MTPQKQRDINNTNFQCKNPVHFPLFSHNDTSLLLLVSHTRATGSIIIISTGLLGLGSIIRFLVAIGRKIVISIRRFSFLFCSLAFSRMEGRFSWGKHLQLA